QVIVTADGSKQRVNDIIVKALQDFIPHLLPEAVLGLAACALFIAGTWRASRHLFGFLALGSLVLAGAALVYTAKAIPTLEARRAATRSMEGEELNGALQAIEAIKYAAPAVHTRLSLFFKILALITGAILVLLGWEDAGEEHPGEYHACLLLIVAGICLTGA